MYVSIFVNLYLHMCIFLFSSYLYMFVCCCLCVLEAYVTKTNSLYAQAYLAIKLFLILILKCMLFFIEYRP